MSAYDLDFSDILDETDSLFGDRSPSINHIIYVAYETIAREFLGTVVKHRRSRFSTTEYTIFTNYLDSHLWFDNLDLNRWFEAWRKY